MEEDPIIVLLSPLILTESGRARRGCGALPEGDLIERIEGRRNTQRDRGRLEARIGEVGRRTASDLA